MKKRIFSFFLVLVIGTLSVLPVSAFTPSGFEVSAKSALMTVFTTGEVLYEKEADTPLPCSSLTMLMAALVIKQNCADLDGYDAEMNSSVRRAYWGTGLPVLDLRQGGRYSIRELLSVALVGSYHDALLLAAETVFGNEDACLGAMNEKAAALGMKNTAFSDICGHNTDGYTTARDMSTLLHTVYSDSVLRDIISTKKYTLEANEYRDKATEKLSGVSFSNTCLNISPATVQYYRNAKAGKSGGNEVAGRCLACYLEADGLGYLCILLGEPLNAGKDANGNTVRKDFRDAKSLTEWAAANFSYRQVLAAGDLVVELPVKYSKDNDFVALAAKTDLFATLPKQSDNSTITYRYSFDEKQAVPAPIEAGDEFGKATVLYGGQAVGEVALVAIADVEASFFLRLGGAAKTLFKNKFFLLFVGIVGAVIVLMLAWIVLVNTRRKIKRSKKVHKDIE